MVNGTSFLYSPLTIYHLPFTAFSYHPSLFIFGEGALEEEILAPEV
jgi:hypothetical protein